jgi:hypothetical protein
MVGQAVGAWLIMFVYTGKMQGFDKGTGVHGQPPGKAWAFCLYGIQSTDLYFRQPQRPLAQDLP